MKYIQQFIPTKCFLAIYLGLSFLCFTPQLSAQTPYYLSYVIGDDGDDALKFPYEVAIDPRNGDIYIADNIARGIIVFDNQGRLVKRIGRAGENEGNFVDPRGLDIDEDGNLYTLDRVVNRVQVFDNQGNFQFAFGTEGSGERQFDAPEGLALDSKKNIYIADTDNRRIQVFDSLGNFIRNFGNFGSGSPRLTEPVDIFIDEKDIVYVADVISNNEGRVKVYDSDGRFLRVFGANVDSDIQEEALIRPSGVCVDRNGFIYVTDERSPTEIKKYTNEGNFVGQVDLRKQTRFSNTIIGPTVFDINVDARGDLYVVLRNVRQAVKLAANGFPPLGYTTPNNSLAGELLFEIGINRSAPGNFVIPFYVTFDTNQDVYIAERDGDRVQRFDVNGYVQEVIGERTLDGAAGVLLDTLTDKLYVGTSANDQLQILGSTRQIETIITDRSNRNQPTGVDAPRQLAFSKAGELLVADRDNDRIQVYSKAGVHLRSISTVPISGRNRFNSPNGVATDTAGNIYIADTENDRIVILDESENLKRFFGVSTNVDDPVPAPGSLNEPEGIAVSKDGSRIFVADSDNNRVQMFDSTGTFIQAFGENGHESGFFAKPTGILLDQEERLFVTDQNNNRIQVFVTQPIAGDVRVFANSPTEIRVEWDDNTTTETGFVVEVTSDSINFNQRTFNLAPNSTVQVVSNLRPLTPYYIRVRVLGVGLDDQFSRVVRFITPTDGPTEFFAAPVSPSSIQLTWKDNSNESTTGFLIEYRRESDPSFNFATTVNADIRELLVEELEANTRYVFRIRALGPVVESNFATASTITFDDVPSDLIAQAISSTEIELAWADNSSTELGYVIQISELQDGNFQDFDSLAPNNNAFMVRGLRPSTTYFFQVKAANPGNFEAVTNSASAATLNLLQGTPKAPVALRVIFISDDVLELEWTDEAGDETGFRVFRSTDNLNFSQIAELNSNISRFVDNSLNLGQTYYYYVLAFNNTGPSGASNTVRATTLATTPLVEAPAALTTEPIERSIELLWEDRSSNEDGFIIERSVETDDNFIEVARVNTNAQSYLDVNINLSTVYFYRVRAFQSSNLSVYSNLSGALSLGNIITSVEDNPVSLENNRFYPNPGTNRFLLNLEDTPFDQIEIFNALGQQVNPQQTIISNNTLEVNLENLPAGLYRVRLIRDDRLIWTNIIKY